MRSPSPPREPLPVALERLCSASPSSHSRWAPGWLSLFNRPFLLTSSCLCMQCIVTTVYEGTERCPRNPISLPGFLCVRVWLRTRVHNLSGTNLLLVRTGAAVNFGIRWDHPYGYSRIHGCVNEYKASLRTANGQWPDYSFR